MTGHTSRTLTVAALAASWLIPLSLQAETYKLEYKPLKHRSRFEPSENDSEAVFRRVRGQYLRMHIRDGNILENQEDSTTSFSKIAKKEPSKYQCKDPFRGVAKLGTFDFAFVLDASDFDKKGYDQCYFDINHNGDLTDDGVLKPAPMPSNIVFGGNSIHNEFPRIDITLNDGKKDYPAAFTLFASVYKYRDDGSEMYIRVNLNSSAYREGEIVIEGMRHHLALIDFNSNGRFDDEYEIDNRIRTSGGGLYPQIGDVLLVNPDLQDRSYAYDLTDRQERHPVSSLLNLGGRYYDLSVSASGETINLTPSPAKLGMMKNPNGPYQALLYNDKQLIKIMAGACLPVPVPAGQWKLASYKIQKQYAARGQPWEDALDKLLLTAFATNSEQAQRNTYVSARGTDQYPAIKVEAGKIADLPFGPPYKPKVVSYHYGGNNLELELQILGSAGEVCSDMSINGDRPKTPTFEIKTEKGEIADSGKFEYG